MNFYEKDDNKNVEGTRSLRDFQKDNSKKCVRFLIRNGLIIKALVMACHGDGIIL